MSRSSPSEYPPSHAILTDVLCRPLVNAPRSGRPPPFHAHVFAGCPAHVVHVYALLANSALSRSIRHTRIEGKHLRLLVRDTSCCLKVSLDAYCLEIGGSLRPVALASPLSSIGSSKCSVRTRGRHTQFLFAVHVQPAFLHLVEALSERIPASDAPAAPLCMQMFHSGKRLSIRLYTFD